MNKHRPQILQYYFSVEGDTEAWYLEWLQKKINENDFCKVKFLIKTEKSPIKYVRGLSIIQRTNVWHLCDYESADVEHTRQFTNTIDEMNRARKLKQVTYHFGYSNFAFDLWIILHRKPCNGAKCHRRQYITEINDAYNKKFEDMHQYKHEDNFKKCLSILTLNDVKCAITRAKNIMQNLRNNGLVMQKYKGYTYYKENPSLAVHEIIEKILTDCQLI